MRALAAILLLLVIGLSPFWLGSNRPLVWAVNACVVGLAVVVAGIGILAARRRHPRLHFEVIAVPLVMVSGALAWAMWQTVPLGGAGHPAWEVEAALLATGLANLALVLSCDRIVLGGGIGAQSSLHALVRPLLADALAGYIPLPALVPPSLGPESGVRGALALAAGAAATGEAG